MPAGDYGNLRYSTLDTIKTTNVDEPARRDDVLDRRAARPRGAAAGLRQHDVRRDAVSQQPDRRRSDQAGRRGEVDLRAASGSARGRHRLLRRRQPRRVVTRDGKIIYSLLDATVVAVDAETGKEVWRTQRRRHQPRRDVHRRRRSSSRITCSSATPAASSACAATSRRSTSRPARSCGARSTPARTRDVKIGPAFHAFYAKDQGKDLGVTLVAGGAVEARRLDGVGLDLVRPGDQPVLLRHRQSRASGIRICGPGDNKWSSSIIARDADTGEARWAYQVTAHDSWDYDEIMENVLVDMDYGGRPRKLIVHPGPHRFRLRARSRNRRAAVGRNVPAGELGERLRPEDRQADRGSRQADALRHGHAGHLSLVDRRQGRDSVGVLAAHRPALHPRAQHLHGLRRHRGELHRRHAVSRRRREDVSRARRLSGRARRLGRRAQPQGVGRQGRRSSRSTAACSRPAATSSSTGRWTAGSRRSTRGPAPSCGSSTSRRASSATRSPISGPTASSTSRSTRASAAGWARSPFRTSRPTIRTPRSAWSAR